MRYILITILMFLLISLTCAQQEAGDTELGLQGMYMTLTGTDDYDFSSGTINAKLGRYFSDHLEVGISPSITIITTTTTTTKYEYFSYPPYYRTYQETETKTNTTFGSGIFAVFSLLTDAKTVPYLGAQYYKQDFDNEEDNGSMGINAGAKFFFTEKAAFDLSGNYLFSLNEESDIGIIMIAFGVSVLL